MSNTGDWETFMQAAREVEKEYFLELEKNKKLSSQIQSLQGQLSEIKQVLAQEIEPVRKEVERLKSVYPLYDLLAAKQLEVERLKKAFKQIDQNHPERKTIASLVKAHIVERDELREIIQAAEHRFRLQFDCLEAMGKEPPVMKKEPPILKKESPVIRKEPSVKRPSTEELPVKENKKALTRRVPEF